MIYNVFYAYPITEEGSYKKKVHSLKVVYGVNTGSFLIKTEEDLTIDKIKNMNIFYDVESLIFLTFKKIDK